MNKRVIIVFCGAALLILPLAMCAGDGGKDRGEGHGASALMPGGGDRDGYGSKALTEDQEAELLSTLKDRQPDTYRRLTELKDSNPARYRMALRGIWPWYQKYKNAPADVQKAMFDEQESRVETWRLVKTIGQTKDPADRARLIGDLKDSVSKEFTAEQVLRENRLNDLEQQIKRLRAELQQRRESREQFLTERVEELLRASSQPSIHEHMRPGAGSAGATTRRAKEPPPQP